MQVEKGTSLSGSLLPLLTVKNRVVVHGIVFRGWEYPPAKTTPSEVLNEGVAVRLHKGSGGQQRCPIIVGKHVESLSNLDWPV